MTTTLAPKETYTTPTLDDNPFRFTKNTVLLVAIAHSDDEALAAIPIKEAIHAKARIVPFTATFGEASDRRSGDEPLSAVRHRESKAAWRAHGVDSLIYPGLPDGQLHRFVGRLTTCLSAVIAQERITDIITLGPSGYGNNDHAVVHQAAVAAARPHPSVRVLGPTTREDAEVWLPPDLDSAMDWLQYNASQFKVVSADHASGEERQWKRMGSFFVRQDSADLLESHYGEFFANGEAYKNYNPSNT